MAGAAPSAEPSAWDELTFDERHRDELQRSGITPAVAIAREYSTAKTKMDLSRVGFKPAQQITPALLMPIYGVSGDRTGYQAKPDNPRVDGDGKTIKYETPGKAKSQLDVPRPVKHLVMDSEFGLFFTEGIKKGDSGASRELPIVSIAGVWNWRGDDVIAELDQIPLKGRTVYLVFDSDWRRKRDVRIAMYRLGKMLQHRGAIVYIISLPEPNPGVKVGLDDYFVAGGTVHDLTAKYAIQFEEIEESAENEDKPILVSNVLPDAPQDHGAIVPVGYTLSSTGIRNAGGSVLPTAAIVTARMIDRLTGEESVQVAFRDRGHWRSLTATRDVIATARKVAELSRSGLPVTSNNAGDVVDWFADYMVANADTLPVLSTSCSLGWQGKAGFLLPSRFITDDHKTAPVVFAPADSGSAQHAGAFEASGSLDGWKDAIRPLASLERVQFAIHSALAAPVLDILQCPSFIVDYCGPTSGGKTSTLRVAGSTWGQSDPAQPSSLLATFQSTRVFKERVAAMSAGLPVIVDDTQQAAKASEIQSFLYDIGNSQGRGRGSLRGMQATANWRTVALISGETPATAATEAGGTKARTLTIWGRPFGNGAHAADLISGVLLGISEHYGQAGPAFAQWLIDNRAEWPVWRAAYLDRVRECTRRAGGGPVISRVSAYIAAVEVAAGLAGLAGVLPWGTDTVSDALLLEMTGEARGADVAAEALLSVLSWAGGRADSFYQPNGSGEQPPGGWLGRWDREDGAWSSIAFPRDRLRNALEVNGFRDVEGITRQWAERDWLDVGKDDGKARRMKKVRMGGNLPMWCYVITRNAEESARAAMNGDTE